MTKTADLATTMQFYFEKVLTSDERKEIEDFIRSKHQNVETWEENLEC